tara:strand:+ start:2794 stop:3168 length:375 start_codon:yes stop_codon:yes gene_type:complete
LACPSYAENEIVISSYYEHEKIYFRIKNNQSTEVVLTQAPWRGEHQPYFIACRKPDLIHCVNASYPVSTAYPYEIKIKAGEYAEGGLYVDSLFIDDFKEIISGDYVVTWNFTSNYGNYFGVVKH